MTKPFKCSRCPDTETHRRLVDGPVAEFARAHGEKDRQVLRILEANDGIRRGWLSRLRDLLR